MTNNDSSYNGYTNYETWNVSLWIDNDQADQDYWQTRALETLEAHQQIRANNTGPANYVGTIEEDSAYSLSNELQESFVENMPELTGTYSDLLSAALRVVNWYEIATNLIEQAKDA